MNMNALISPSGGPNRRKIEKIAKGLLAGQNQVLINGVEAAAGANAINGTTNTSVPLFDDANLVQVGSGIGVTATADSAASGTIFTALRAGIYEAKFMFTAAVSQDLQAAIALNPSDPITGAAEFGGEDGVRSAGSVLTPAATEASITVEAEIHITTQMVQLGNNVIVPLVNIAGGASPDEEDFAQSTDITFELTQVATFR